MTFPMAMLRALKPNWNSYGAPVIDERCIQKAYELWRQLSGEWQVVPCNDGGVQLEQHRDGFDIEITVSAESTAKETSPVQAVCDRAAHLADVPVKETPVAPDADVASKTACSCKYSDSWRCAVARGLTSVSCGCQCHRATANRGVNDGR